MSEPITHFVNRRDPPLEATLSTDGTTDPLPVGATVTFSMRLVGSTTLKVSAATATVVSEPLNQVRYDWAALDVDTAGFYVGWWTVTSAGKAVDTPEFAVWIREHAPLANQYISAEELRQAISLAGETYADAQIDMVIEASSRALETVFRSRWYTTVADETRYYSPRYTMILDPDEIVSLTSLAVGQGGISDFTTWVLNTDFVLEPLNGALDGVPFRRVRVVDLSGKFFYPYTRSVRIIGRFGWANIPAGVKTATEIVATKLLKRVREVPFGILPEGIRIASFDPDVQQAMAPYDRRVPFA